MGASQSVMPTGPLVEKIEPEREGESYILRSIKAKDGLVATFDDEIKTIYDGFMKSVKLYPKSPCLGKRVGDGPYQWTSYEQTAARVHAVGSGFLELGLEAKSRVGIYAPNREEWVLTMLGCDAYSMCCVPLYDTLGPNACAYIVNQAELTIVVAASDKVIHLLTSDTPMESLKTIIYMNDVTDEVKKLAEEKNVELISFAELEKKGAENKHDPIPPQRDDHHVICYTSGTTGDPKGVILTHGNLIAAAAGAIFNGVKVTAGDVHISYLPLAHSFEMIVMTVVLSSGAAAGFYRGEILKLFDDIEELKPTIFCSVPRLYNRLYSKVMDTIEATGGIKKRLFDRAYNTKRQNLKNGYLTHRLWDNLVFKKIRMRLGGRVRIMATGSAPISNTVMEFLRICFSAAVIEGYGQTECSAVCTTTLPADVATLEHVGLPLACVEMKLVDVPDLDYLTTDKPYPRGEVCLRGPSVTEGYYKLPDKTAEAIDEHGWLHTGDIGTFLDNGSLKIIDRKKAIFKLSQGEYIAPEKLENTFVQSKYVAQVFVYGNSLKSRLVAIVVPDFENLVPKCKELGMDTSDQSALCANPEAVKLVLEDMNAKGKEHKLRGFEMITRVHLAHEPFSVENNLLTPSFKIKRPQLQAYYKDAIDEMYKDLD